MELDIFTAFFILIGGGIPLLFAWIFYYGAKKLGYPIGGILAGIGFLVCIGYIGYSMTHQEELFDEGDALSCIGVYDFIPKQSVKLQDVRINSDLHQYSKSFTLQISKEDKAAFIQKIKKAPRFKWVEDPTELFINTDRFHGKTNILDYETTRFYVHEYFQTHGDGYAPTHESVSIEKEGNHLFFDSND